MTDTQNEWATRLREVYPWFPEEVHCGSGWAKIIADLCKKIQEFLNAHDDYRNEFCVTVCKEKYGHLACYTFPEREEIESLIDDASMTSAFTCEICGAPGAVESEEIEGDGSWVVTRCENCRKK